MTIIRKTEPASQTPTADLSNSILIISLITLPLLFGFFWASPPTWDEVNTSIAKKFPDVESIGTAELKRELAENHAIILIDVRAAKEYEISHLPGAIHYKQTGDAGLSKTSDIVVYCSVGVRSAAYARKMRQQGYLRVKNLKGSPFEWANKGYPLQNKDGTATKVHPFNSHWGNLLQPDYHY